MVRGGFRRSICEEEEGNVGVGLFMVCLGGNGEF